jgi:ATP-dependent Clp protease ATP-binding subunit ClpC
VDFRNTIIIMTSNIGARDIKNLGKGIGFAQSDETFDYKKMKSTVEDALKRVFNPEFLNRIDDVIVFHPLEKKHIFEIIDIMQKDLFARVEALGIDIELAPEAKEFLVDKGFDPQFGARPLRRAIQKYVEDPMAESILSNDLGEGDAIIVHREGQADELAFKLSKGAAKPKPKKKAAPPKAAEPPAPAPDEPEQEEPASEEQQD